MEISAVRIPGAVYLNPPQSPDENEIFCCLEGSGYVVIDGVRHDFEAGDVVCIPAGVVHQDAAPVLCSGGLMRFASTDAVKLDEFRIYHDTDGTFRTLFNMACDALERDELPQRIFANMLGDAMLQLLRCFGQFHRQGPEDAVAALDRLIHQNISTINFNLAQAIARTGYTDSYIRRLYRQAVGRPPQAQLNHLRIEYAMEQMKLRPEGVTVRQFSWESGFADPYYFSRLFHRETGMSPAQYLRQQQDRPDPKPIEKLK